MDGLDSRKRFVGMLERYKYALAVALLGMILMLFPGQKDKSEPKTIQPESNRESMEQMLEDVLAQVQGAGSVKVLLSQQTGEETLYQTDTEESADSDSNSNRSQTVIVSDESRTQSGLVRRTDPPRYLGAVIVCQGGDDAQVRLAIVEAVACVTGLRANQIAVLKMK